MNRFINERRFEMPKYFVEAEFVETHYVRQIIEIEADNRSEAIDWVMDGEGEPKEVLERQVVERYQQNTNFDEPIIVKELKDE